MRRIRNKIMLTMMVLTLLPAILIGAYSFYSTSDALRENALIEQRNQLTYAQQIISSTVSRVESDLLFLRDSSAVQLYLAAKRSSAKRSKLLLTNLRSSIQQFAQQQQIYSSVRFFDLSGKEQVRIENVAGIATSLEKRGELLSRGKREYFKQTLNLKTNQIYISPLELRKNGDELAQLLQGTLRYSTIVRNANGARQGVLVLNIDADALIGRIVGTSQAQWTIALTDPDGFYYYHPDESKRWSGPDNLNTKANIFDDKALPLTTVKGSQQTVTSESESMLSLSTPIELGKGRPTLGYLFSMAPKAALFKPLNDYLTVSLIIAGVSLLLSLIFAAMLANSLSEPLVDLKDQVERLSRGDLESPIGSNTKNEIGDLSRAVELLRKSMNILMSRSGKPNS
ncbi:MAG: HAMP domain-containing protein [Leucothrix sp.]